MKNVKNLFSIFIFILFGLSSCKNESIETALPDQVVNADRPHPFNPKVNPNDDVISKLRAFSEKLDLFQKNVAVRDAQTVSVEQVEWNIEAYLNSAYGRADKPFLSSYIIRDSFMVSLTNGEVSGANVLSALANAKSIVKNQYHSEREASKHLVFIDISAKLVGSQLQISVASCIGLNPLQSRNVSAPFTWTDNWKWAFHLGRCDGTLQGNDGTQRMSDELNFRYQYYSYGGYGTNIYFTDIEDIWIVSNFARFRVNETGYDNIRDYLLFYSDALIPNYTDCIGYLDMNWYYQNLYNIVSSRTFPGIRPLGKDFMYSGLAGDGVTTENARYQIGLMTFGVPHYSIGDPEPL